jgi:peptidoglycan DL-endopeptidase CwlO
MKSRFTTPILKRVVTQSFIGVTIGAVVLGTILTYAPSVSADKYDDQIRALQKEIEQYQAKAQGLQAQIASLQVELKGLDDQKRLIQTQIDLTQVKLTQLQEKIVQTEKDIHANRTALGRTIADIYIDNAISPLEMLASSRNIGDFVDKQEYRSGVRENLSVKIDQIKKLNAELEAQKTEAQRTLTDQTNARATLVAKENERVSLLTRTQGQQSTYQQLTDAREAQKLRVQQQQQAAIEAAIRAASGGRGTYTVLEGSSGGYPWNASNCYVDSNAWSHGGIDGNGSDAMGYGCRQCVSYVAWRAWKETGYAPMYWGDASDFPASGRKAGFTVSSQPRERSAGVITSGGRPGHIVWVESVNNAGGTMDVSQYNYFNAGGSGWGHYSKMRVPIGTYQQYVYF